MNRKAIILFLALIFPFLMYHGGEAVEMEEQIKFDVADPHIFETIKGWNNVLSYKVKYSGEYVYEDYY